MPDRLEVREIELEQKLGEDLHRQYGRLIHYILNMFSLSDDCHQDLFNQVFLKILKGLKNLKHSENIKSWVTTITRNEIRSYLRRREREVCFPKEMDNGLILFECHDCDGVICRTPEDEIYNKQLKTAFNECVGRLDPHIREAFLLRYREFLKWEEIADVLELNIDKARRRAEKGKQLVVQGMQKRLGSGSRIQQRR